MDLWPMTLQARHALLSTFEGLGEDQWEVRSLCDGWTIRQVLTIKDRPAVRWTATDHPWSYGDGPEVRGTMEDLALTAAGRAAHIDHLEGEGVTVLERWLR